MWLGKVLEDSKKNPNPQTNTYNFLRANMGVAVLEPLPVDIFYLIAERCPGYSNGYELWCKLAAAFPRLSRVPLPRATLLQLARQDLPWEGFKWALLKQPSASLIEISIQKDRPRVANPWTATGIIVTDPRLVKVWGGRIQQIQDECNEEVEALVEMSEDKRGHRHLVLKVFPAYTDDAATFPVDRIYKHLQPWVHKLLQHGSAELWGLKLHMNSIVSPELLGQLPLRHLDLKIDGRSPPAQLKEITAALGQCTTLEHLHISAVGYASAQISLPDLCLYKASNMTNIHLQRCFPEGRLCLPPDCQLRLDEVWSPCWESKKKSENGQELLGCIPAVSMGFTYGRSLTPSSFRDFKILQYLHLFSAQELKDLAVLQGVPHVVVELPHSTVSLLHSAGSWKSLQIMSKPGYSYHISFADIEAFVRDNPKYLFEACKGTKEWRSMVSALKDASAKQGVPCFTNDPERSIDKRVSTIQRVAESTNPYSYRYDPYSTDGSELVCVNDFWPKRSMQSCLSSAAPISKVDVMECKCRMSDASLDQAGQWPFRVCMTWLANRLKPTCMRPVTRDCIGTGKNTA